MGEDQFLGKYICMHRRKVYTVHGRQRLGSGTYDNIFVPYKFVKGRLTGNGKRQLSHEQTIDNFSLYWENI